MMTQEEYQETLVRMWDNLRTRFKGDETCNGVSCFDCPFNGKLCNGKFYNVGKIYPYDIIETVEKWGKENLIKEEK